MEEAARCLNCKHKPCVGGCPVNIRIPEFIAKVAEGDFQAAYDIISDTTPAQRQRPCLPSGGASVRPGASGPSRASRWPSAGWSALWPIGTGRMSTPCLRSPRPMASRWRWWLRPRQLDLRQRSGQARLRGYHLRGLPHRRRRAGVRHPRVPPAQGHRAERGGQAHRPGRGSGDRYVIGKTFDIDEMFEEGYEPCSSVPARACPCLWASRARPWRGCTPPTST